MKDRSCFTAPAVGLLVCLITPRARADAESVNVTTYEVPAACPSERALRDQIVRRTRPGSKAAAFDLRIDVRGKRHFRGRIGIQREGSERTERSVEAPTCDEVVSALALVAALSMGKAEPLPEEGAVATGFTCQSTPTEKFCGLASECSTANATKPTCEGTNLVVCNAGKITKVDCTSLGFTSCSGQLGMCAPNGVLP